MKVPAIQSLCRRWSVRCQPMAQGLGRICSRGLFLPCFPIQPKPPQAEIRPAADRKPELSGLGPLPNLFQIGPVVDVKLVGAALQKFLLVYDLVKKNVRFFVI